MYGIYTRISNIMTETIRTTVTLSEFTMKQVNDLVGVFGNSAASVISKIVEHFFDYGRFDDILLRLKKKKRELYPPEEEELGKMIPSFLKAADDIPLNDFLAYLKIEKNYALAKLPDWARIYGINLINGKIKKI